MTLLLYAKGTREPEALPSPPVMTNSQIISKILFVKHYK